LVKRQEYVGRLDKSRYQGEGVETAVAGLNKKVNSAVSGQEFDSQEAFDKKLIELDGTTNSSV
jgi:enolase